jgi:hypothetical protein
MPNTAAEQIKAADLVIGLVPPSQDAATIDRAITRITELIPPAAAVLLHPPYAGGDAASGHRDGLWQLEADSQLAQDQGALAQSLGESFRAVFESAQNRGARACAIIASDLSTVTAEWIAKLLEPIVEEDYDVVAPCYARHPFESLINRAIVYPLIRALYGKRIRNPFGPDFGISRSMLARISSGPKSRFHPLASLTSEAVTSGMKVCQTHLGERISRGAESMELSSLLVQVLAPLFLDVERYAVHWQRTRGSEAVTEFGEPLFLPGPGNTPKVTGLIESFQLGTRNLTEVWGPILPPSTLVELRRLARNDSNAFRLPDETWARVVYDFALAHRLRTINREQLLRAITPIYLGWLASYALELETASAEAVEEKLERLCIAFESTKPYFVSRWRWPDRFNP